MVMMSPTSSISDYLVQDGVLRKGMIIKYHNTMVSLFAFFSTVVRKSSSYDLSFAVGALCFHAGTFRKTSTLLCKTTLREKFHSHTVVCQSNYFRTGRDMTVLHWFQPCPLVICDKWTNVYSGYWVKILSTNLNLHFHVAADHVILLFISLIWYWGYLWWFHGALGSFSTRSCLLLIVVRAVISTSPPLN